MVASETIRLSGKMKDALEELKKEEDHTNYDSVVRQLYYESGREL